MAELVLRDYQEQLVADIRDAWTRHRAVLAWLPTGGGKTEIAVHLAQSETCTLFVVDRKTLAGQTRQRYASTYNMLTGLLRGDDSYVRGYEPVVIATIQTLRARWEHTDVRQLLARVTLVVLDEAHIRFKHHDEIVKHIPNARVLGLSATPLRQGLGLTFEALVRGPSYAHLIEAGHLVPARCFVPHGDDLRDALRSVGVASTGDFITGALSALMRNKTLIGDVVNTWTERAQDRQTIVFAVDIAHSKALCDGFALAGIAAEHIDHRTNEETRAGIFERFRSGQTRVLCSVAVLAVGFDEPAASCAILARPTLSLSLHIQQIGRAMRPHPGKRDALVLDHAGNVLRHGKAEDFDPPDLSEIDSRSDRKAPASTSDYYPCSECRAVMSPGQRVCGECGHEMARRNVVHFEPGELVEDADDHQGMSHDDYRDLYLELRGLHEARGKDQHQAARTAYAQLLGNFEFKAPYTWLSMPAQSPSTRTINLDTSWRIRWAKSQEKKRRAEARTARAVW